MSWSHTLPDEASPTSPPPTGDSSAPEQGSMEPDEEFPASPLPPWERNVPEQGQDQAALLHPRFLLSPEEGGSLLSHSKDLEPCGGGPVRPSSHMAPPPMKLTVR